MMGSHSGIQKKFKNLLLRQKVHCVTDIHLLAKLTNAYENFHFQFGIT